MGYQGIAAQEGEKILIGATFSKIDGNKVTLGDVKINELFSAQSDAITVLDEFGGTKGKYCYVGPEQVADAAAEGQIIVEGWYDYQEWADWDWESPISSCNDEPVPAGTGFMLEVGIDEAGVIIPSAI